MKILSILFLLISSSIFSQQIDKVWQTVFEKSNYLSTANYNDSMEFFRKFISTGFARFYDDGNLISPQGRPIRLMIVSKDKAIINAQNIQQELKKSEKPLVFIQNGIHSGEIEGKDACMLLLREILVSREKFALLDNVNIAIVPIFNVDGHERKSPYNRINQNGPLEMGWRTTAQNYNLNRDYIKADSPEMRILLNWYEELRPDFFIDTHTTDGADYQYTITYDVTKYKNTPPIISNFIRKSYIPYIETFVEKAGFKIAPYLNFVGRKIEDGIGDWVASPRFSHGYVAIRNRPGLLIETHMLKPYKDRVFSTKSMLEGVVKFVGENSAKLKNINSKADKFVIENYASGKLKYPIKFSMSKESKNYIYKGKESKIELSSVTGENVKSYSDKNFEKTIPYYNNDSITASVKVPRGYLIPLEYKSLFEERVPLAKSWFKNFAKEGKYHVEELKFRDIKFASFPYENHFRVNAQYDKLVKYKFVKKNEYFFVSCNTRDLGLLIHVFEPKSEDSFLRWGLFNQIFERKEYFEVYSMEPIAKKMIEENPGLRIEFNSWMKKHPEMKGNRAKLNWFYERSKYYDKKLNVYPILRVIE